MTPKAWKTISSRPIYQNKWMALREDIAEMPDGRTTIYGVVTFGHCVGVVPLTADGLGLGARGFGPSVPPPRPVERRLTSPLCGELRHQGGDVACEPLGREALERPLGLAIDGDAEGLGRSLAARLRHAEQCSRTLGVAPPASAWADFRSETPGSA